ncbi:hypothetical protein KP509_04G013300 [Ceratopteris richardii]|uniref:UspA domain-containing protein n=1 Tax=Ceratopteris richardii TaxID=49495 RepID=A0A8T2UY35_CERRI|nr:hypothetical protein KP509_04G013300 [Ceratopteris richardii]
METPRTEDVQHEEAVKTTVVALDQGEESFHALEWALETIRFGASDKVVLIHARTSPASRLSAFGGPGYIVSTDLILNMEKAQEREINEFMDRALQLCEKKQVKAVKLIVYGDARDVISEETKKLHANMLVIGSHGYGAVKRTFLGSVSDYCVHHVECPVVIVKKKPEKKDA